METVTKKQEPVALDTVLRKAIVRSGKVIHPPQRQPLTDEQIDLIDQSMCGDREFYKQFARAIEAAHGIA